MLEIFLGGLFTLLFRRVSFTLLFRVSDVVGSDVIRGWCVSIVASTFIDVFLVLSALDGVGSGGTYGYGLEAVDGKKIV